MSARQKAPVENLAGIFDAASKIAAARAELLAKLKAALESGDDSQALEFARELCGVSQQKEVRIASQSNRADSRIH